MPRATTASSGSCTPTTTECATSARGRGSSRCSTRVRGRAAEHPRRGRRAVPARRAHRRAVFQHGPGGAGRGRRRSGRAGRGRARRCGSSIVCASSRRARSTSRTRTSPQLSFALAGKVELPADDKLGSCATSPSARGWSSCSELLEHARADGAARPACGRAGGDERPGRPRVRRARQGYDGARGRDDRSRSSTRIACARTSPCSTSSSTASPSRSSTRRRRRRSRGRCSTRCATSTSTRTRTSTAASTGSPSARRPATRRRAAKVAGFVNAPSEREVIFTRSATEALNLVAYAWGLDNLGPGDVVVVTDLEHHSSFVPWQYVAGPHGRGVQGDPDRRVGRASARRARRDRARREP